HDRTRGALPHPRGPAHDLRAEPHAARRGTAQGEGEGMKDVPVADTRNFALVGHAADGKTSLGEALLLAAGAIRELGSVPAGNAALTTLPEEKERQGASVGTAVYAFDWNGRHLTLVDTP